MSPKYILLVGDGMADFPIPELGGKTPLEYANTPGMDDVAHDGTIGLVSTVPQGLPPGSDVANLSLMGYDPGLYYSGRAPIEAASMGVQLSPDDTAFRCNLVTVTGGRMDDYSAGHIETEDAHAIVTLLKKRLDTAARAFYPGVSYRHLLVIRDFPKGCECTPPHDISGREVAEHLPKGPGSRELTLLMNDARSLLADAPANQRRLERGKKAATDIWLWGQGRTVTLPSLKSRYSLSGSVISAVDLVRGLGVLAGLTVRIVEGATGYLGTNYSGKVAAALEAIGSEDFVYLHVEAPDETSHEGSLEKKIKAIEEFDKHVVGEMLKYQRERGDIRLLVAPDHATPLALKTHHAAPVPYTACGPGIHAGRATGYGETAAGGKQVLTGPELFDRFIRGSFDT